MYALYVCLIFACAMPCMYALYVCRTGRHFIYLHAPCLICMPYMYALYVCRTGRHFIVQREKNVQGVEGYVCLAGGYKNECRYVYASCVCLICVHYVYALYVCLTGSYGCTRMSWRAWIQKSFLPSRRARKCCTSHFEFGFIIFFCALWLILAGRVLVHICAQMCTLA